MTSAFFWQNSISLCPASFRTPRPNFPVAPGVSWLPTFAFQSPLMKRTSFLGVSTRRSFMSSQNGQLQLFQHQWLGLDQDYCDHQDYCDVEWFALETNQDYYGIYEIAPKYCILDSSVDCENYSISSKVFLPAVVDIMVI